MQKSWPVRDHVSTFFFINQDNNMDNEINLFALLVFAAKGGPICFNNVLCIMYYHHFFSTVYS